MVWISALKALYIEHITEHNIIIITPLLKYWKCENSIVSYIYTTVTFGSIFLCFFFITKNQIKQDGQI